MKYIIAKHKQKIKTKPKNHKLYKMEKDFKIHIRLLFNVEHVYYETAFGFKRLKKSCKRRVTIKFIYNITPVVINLDCFIIRR